jgi:putative transposase
MKSYKIRLELTNKQVTLAKQHAGASRYAYNWALAKCKQGYENKGENEVYHRPSAIDLHKMWVKEVKSSTPWTYEVSKCTPQQAFRNLATAYQRYFKVKGSGHPTFQKKGVRDSFYLEGAIHTNGSKLKLPKLGWVTCSELLPSCTIKNVVISRTSTHWFVSFKTTELPAQVVDIEAKAVIGVDIGIKSLATLSDGLTFPNKRPYKTLKRKLKLAQRAVTKKYCKGAKSQSKNYQKAKKKVAKIHYQIACIRQDSLHKLTHYLAKNHSEIVVEDLNIKGMSKNHRLASAILDGGFYEFRRQLVYKSAWYGSKVTVVDRFYPSSKTCSSCQVIKKELRLSERLFTCSSCGLRLDRDLNAAINLRNKSVSYTAFNACGEVHTPTANKPRTSTKQEINNKPIL